MPTVEVSAGRMHYVEEGEGPPVVLLHGLVMNHTVWDDVVKRLPEGFRYIRPDLPFGGHPIPLRPDADLTQQGMCRLLADFLAALDLRDVTLVHSDWGGGLFLTAYGWDQRVGRLIVLPCEAFDNFPPGLPGRLASVAARVPGGLSLVLRQLQIRWLRQLPLLFGHMARKPIPDALMHGWTEPGLRNHDVLRDLRAYATQRLVASELIANTEALRYFSGDALVLWSSEGKLMPREHGRRLAELLPRGRLIELDDSYVLSMLDRPLAVAEAMSAFLIGDRTHR